MFFKRSRRKWHRFAGRPNDQPTLRQKAELLAGILLVASDSLAEQLAQVLPTDSAHSRLVSESLFIHLSLIDHVVLEELGPIKRPWLMEPLHHEVIRQLAGFYKDDQVGLMAIESFREFYSKRMIQYADCDLVGSRNEQDAAKIGCSYGYQLLQALGAEEPDCVSVVLPVMIAVNENALSFWKNFRFRDFISGK